MDTKKILSILNNPNVYQIGKLNARSFKHAINPSNSKDLLELLLDGQWNFSFEPNITNRNPNFMNESEFQTTISVPSHIELGGHGQIHYVNTQYPWDGTEDVKIGQSPLAINYCGQYSKTIEIDDIGQYEQYIICFEGVESAFNLWINGNHVGYSTDSFTTAEFEIKDYLVEGNNQISVEVYKYSASSWLDDQDFWRLSGIFRSVILKKITNEHVYDFKIDYTLSDDLSSVYGQVILDKRRNFNVDVEIYYKDELLKIFSNSENNIAFSLDNVDLWSAELPNLYTFVIKTSKEQFEKKIGFRKIEIVGNVIKYNNKRIIFKGINRHEFDCSKGRAIGYDEIYKDLKLLKEYNFNSIRCSHYPNNNIFYELCDELGFYVIDEVNLETHGTWMVQGQDANSEHVLPGNDSDYHENVLSRASNLYERDKNNTCVIIWSLGNESYGGETLFDMHNYFKSIDPSRLTHYEGIWWDRSYPKTSDIESQMYTRSFDIEKFIEENDTKPFILCEFSHAMGNSNGNFEDYLALEEKYPNYQGGFIWEYMDQALLINDRFHYGGDFGECPSDYNFICDGLVGSNREVTSELKYISNLHSQIKVTESEGSFYLRNTNIFKTLNNLKLVLSEQTAHSQTRVASKNISIEPQNEIELSKLDSPGVVLYQLFEEGKLIHEFSTVNYVIQKIDTSINNQKFVDGDHNFSISSDDFSIVFSKIQNNVVSIKYDNQEIIESFESLPKPNFWRAPTNNDMGAGKHAEFAIWNAVSKYQSSKIKHYAYADNCLYVEIEFRSHLIPEYLATMTYKVDSTGKIILTIKYNGIKDVVDFFEFGFKTKLNSRFNNCIYLGCADIDTYIDRNTDVCQKYSTFEVNEQKGYLYPQEFGNKTQVQYIELFDNSNNGIIIESDNKFEFSIISYSDSQLENVRNRSDLHIEAPELKVNYKQAGVAGDDTWGSWCKPKSTLSATDSMQFTVFIRKR